MNERVARIEGDNLLDLPLQAQALVRLSPRERARYQQALSLLNSGGGIHALALNDIPVAGLGVYEALLARSWAVRFSSPQEMIGLAEVAVELAENLEPRRYGVKRVADLRARALGELANAYRVADRLPLAGRAFGRAYAWFKEGTNAPRLLARLFDLEASLLGTRREFALALPRFRSLSKLYRDLGDSHLSGRALIALALYTHYGGDSEEAIQINEEGMRRLDRRREPILYMQAIHNHLLFLVELGRYGLAKRAIFENRRNLIIYKDPINALRLRGLEGQIYYGLGELVSAEVAFSDAKEGLIQEDMSFYVALVSLELAMVFLRQGRAEDAEREVVAAQKIFQVHEVYREYLGALMYLQMCIRQREESTAELVEATLRVIRRKEIETLRPRR